MSAASPALAALVAALPFVLLGLVLLLLCIVAYLVRTLRATHPQVAPPTRDIRSSAAPAETPPAPTDRSRPSLTPASPLRQSFTQALQRLQATVGGRNVGYQLPWFLLLGEAASGKTTLLHHLGVHDPVGAPEEERLRTHPPCNWWLFEHGVVLDIAGEVLWQTDENGDRASRWHRFLELLQKNRPARPLDGVILTISCTGLIGQTTPRAEYLTDIRDKAAHLSKALWQAQQMLGMRFPVYVLVTKCDQLPGFQSLCRNLPKSRWDDMFGWSSPHAIETAYTPMWVDEAFHSLSGDLLQAQREVFAERTEVRDGDGLFLLPTTFRNLQEPLRIYLDQLFTPNTAPPSCFFRGLYFCGDGGVEATSSPVNKPMFLRHLFDNKIFPEYGLARPTARKLASARRTVRVAQALLVGFVLVGGLGLWRASHRLADTKRTLVPALEKIATDMEGVEALISKEEEVTTAGNGTTESLTGLSHELRARVQSSTAAIQDLKGQHGLASFFLPNSWFDLTPTVRVFPLNAAVSNTVAEAEDHIILRSTQDRLLTTVNEPLPSPPRGSDERQQWLQGLLAYVGDLQQLEQLEKDDARRQDIMSSEAKAQHAQKIWEWVQLYYDSLFRPNPVLTHLDGLVRLFQEVEVESDSLQGFRELLACMQQTQTVLEASERPGLASAELNLGEPFNKVLASIRSSAWLGPALSAEIEADGNVRFQAFKDALNLLAESQVDPIGSLLQPGERQPFPKLSESAEKLGVAMKDWLQQPFMVSNEEPTAPTHRGNTACHWDGIAPPTVRQPKRLTTTLPPGTQLVWDTGRLHEALQLTQQYDDFLAQGLKSFPPSWQQTVTNLSLDQLEMQMLARLDQAQQIEPVFPPSSRSQQEAALRVAITGFQEAAGPVNSLLETLKRLALAGPHGHLLTLITQQAQHLLHDVDTRLTQASLYTAKPGTFSEWHGEMPLAFLVFGVRDDADLAAYLTSQRQHVGSLATAYAQPLLTFLMQHSDPQDPGRAALPARWREIQTALDAYEQKTPGNAVALLEQFILTMNDFTGENCLPKETATPKPLPGGNYFLRKHDTLRREFVAQCQMLTPQLALALYQGIEAHFTQHLAGRFPFADIESDTVGTAATPAAIRAFYRVFDASAPTLQTILKHRTTFGGTGDDILTFLQRLEKVRTFFAPFIDGVEGLRLPVFDVQVAFRVNRRHERGADQIIDWQLHVADQRLRHRDAQSSLQARWGFGDPIRLALRWAKDAPSIPLASSAQVRESIEDHTIVYTDTSPWSLLRFLRRHAGSLRDFDQLIDPEPHTLAFTITTGSPEEQRTPREGNQAATALTKVFIRVIVMSPDSKARLVMPYFPAQAPPLPQTAQH